METYGLDKIGITVKSVGRNLSPSALTKLALRDEPDAMLMDKGALLVETGKYTGRSAQDKYIVEEPSSKDKINWVENKKISQETADAITAEVKAYLSGLDNVYIFDGFAGADPEYRLSIRVVNEYASQNLFMNNMLIRPTKEDLAVFAADYVLLCAPGLKLDAKKYGIHSEAAIILDFGKKTITIAGSKYSGEMKKSVFSVMNYELPLKGVLGMHCSANMATDGTGHTALFYGLSGTGKTTLSADPNRGLIGDDEHGWSDNGIFNIEGGCYAKCIDLKEESEPEIYHAIRHGAVVENVVVNKETGEPDYKDKSITENTRVSYPVTFIDNAVIPGIGGHPTTVIFLTYDAYGVLPPISKLTIDQAKFYFVSGFTSKVAGTERGITEPQPTFSTCFGAPFLPLPSKVYADMLGEKIEKHGAAVYLINTGLTGGVYGVGTRMSIKATRACVTAALNGSLKKAEYETDPIFGFAIPKAVEGVDPSVLNPRNAWKDKKAYEETAKKLAASFRENIKKFNLPEEVVAAGPKA